MHNNRIQIVGQAVRRIPCVSLLLTVTAAIIHLSYSLRIQLLYDRSAPVHHELWRLITCHWVHLSTSPLLVRHHLSISGIFVRNHGPKKILCSRGDIRHLHSHRHPLGHAKPYDLRRTVRAGLCPLCVADGLVHQTRDTILQLDLGRLLFATARRLSR